MLLQGQDAGWGLRNHHLYNPIAWVDGRFERDIAPAQLQTWLNPLLDLPMALAVMAGAPGWLVSLWLAAFSVVALYFALRILDALWPCQRSTMRTLLAGIVAISGAGVWSNVGTTLNDAMVAAAVLPSLWWLLVSGDRGVWTTWCPVGVLAGAATGLKLSGGIYCLGFAAAALVAGKPGWAPLRLFALAASGAAGFALTAGPWMWTLWQRHGNPVFPYFNQVFASPDALPLSWMERHTVSGDALHALIVPIRLLAGHAHAAQADPGDPRMLLGAIVLVIAATVNCMRCRSTRWPEPTDEVALCWPFIAFCLGSFLSWLYLHPIYRSALALELLGSILCVGMVSALSVPRWRAAVLAVLAMALVVVTERPHWRRKPFATPMVWVQFPALPEHAMVVIDGVAPVAHAVPFLPERVAVVALSNNFISPNRCTRMQRRVAAALNDHGGPIYLLRPAKCESVTATMARYGLRRAGRCIPVPATLVPIELCPLAQDGGIVPTCLSPQARSRQ